MTCFTESDLKDPIREIVLTISLGMRWEPAGGGHLADTSIVAGESMDAGEAGETGSGRELTGRASSAMLGGRKLDQCKTRSKLQKRPKR